MTAYRAGVRDRSGPMKSVKIPDRSGELEPAMSDFFSRSHSSFVTRHSSLIRIILQRTTID